jgi:hypothetical protein
MYKIANLELLKRSKINSEPLKVLCHEMNIFMMAHKIKSEFSLHALVVLKFFLSYLLKNQMPSFYLRLWKHLLILKSFQ